MKPTWWNKLLCFLGIHGLVHTPKGVRCAYCKYTKWNDAPVVTGKWQ